MIRTKGIFIALLLSFLLSACSQVSGSQVNPKIVQTERGAFRIHHLPFNVPTILPRLFLYDDDDCFDDEFLYNENDDDDRCFFDDEIWDDDDEDERYFDRDIEEERDERKWISSWKTRGDNLEEGEIILCMKKPLPFFDRVEITYDLHQTEPIHIDHGTADLRCEGRQAYIWKTHNKDTRITLGGKIHALYLEGNFKLNLDLPEEDSLLIQGAGRITGTVNSKNTTSKLYLAGIQDIKIEGNTSTLDLLTFGDINVDAVRFPAKEATVHTYGASQIAIQPEKRMGVRMYGIGCVRYVNNSSLQKEISVNHGGHVESTDVPR